MVAASIASDLLIFVVGRSGSGKDTLMRKAMDILLLKKIPVSILKRTITRPSDKTEESFYVSNTEFLKKLDENEFALSWSAYDNWYGCPRAPLEDSLKRGEIIMVNVSRSVLYEAREKYPQSKILFIDVPISLAEKRIKARGRENDHLLTERLNRMKETVDMPTPDLIIHNDGDLEKAVTEISNYLKSLYSKTEN
jgi:phosphonate metabolism protein PhnN/1,5-bisphosphokinase (PRPP-forming)